MFLFAQCIDNTHIDNFLITLHDQLDNLKCIYYYNELEKEGIKIAKRRKNGEGTLRLRKDGRWEGRVVVDYNEKGQPITKSVTAKTKTECGAKLEKLKEQYGRLILYEIQS